MKIENEASRFATTCWSDIRRAQADPELGRDALEQLCKRYWYPLYAFLRRSGHSVEESQDYVQGFFADLFSRDSLDAADPGRGRFRTFMLSACQNFVRNQIRHQTAQRRGGDRVSFSLSDADGEGRYQNEPTDGWTAERLFQRRWALQVIDSALLRLRENQIAAGREERFDALRPLIAPGCDPPSHASIAEKLGVSVGSVKVSVHRLRQQFGIRLREEIASTIDAESPEEHRRRIDEELQELLAALGS